MKTHQCKSILIFSLRNECKSIKLKCINIIIFEIGGINGNTHSLNNII